MKIAMMTNNYKPYIGGVPISIERLSEGLRKIGHEVVVFAPAYSAQAYLKEIGSDTRLAIRKQKRGSDFRLAIVGEGPYQKKLHKLADELELREEIVFVGKVPNEQVKNYCKAADLFLFSSLSETQGIVLLEAMAAATPVLAVKASGVRDIVVNGRNGYMTYLSEIEFEGRLDDLLGQDRTYLEKGALETAKKYEMREIARWAAIHYNIAMQRHKVVLRHQSTMLKYY